MSKEVYEKIVRIFPVILYLLAVYFLAYVTDETIPLVLAGMMPALVNLFVLMFFDPNKKENHVIVFAAPPVLGLLFIVLWNAGVNPTVTSMDGPTVAFLNVVLGYVMLLFFMKREPRKVKVVKKEIVIEDPEVQELRERVKEDTEEMIMLREQIRKYENQLLGAKKATKLTTDQVTPFRQLIAQYQERVQQDSKELEKMKRMLVSKELELQTTRQDAHINEQRLAPLRDTVNRYHAKARADEHELNRLRNMLTDYAHELQMTKKEVQTSLRSIEDKCKALNFTIGRVYADKKGGSAEVREKLHIPRELYNDFTEIIKYPQNADTAKLKKVLNMIIAKLNQLELDEKKAIRVKKGRVPLVRETGDTVLQVLARNDKDPVLDYHAEAKLICEKLIDMID